MAYGGIYGAFFLENLHELRDSQFKKIVILVGAGGIEEAEEQFEEMEETEALIESIRSSHAHLSLFGLIAIAIASNISKIQLKESWKIAASLAFLLGSLLFSVAIVLQPLVSTTPGKFLSIIGGSVIMLSIAAYIWGF